MCFVTDRGQLREEFTFPHLPFTLTCTIYIYHLLITHVLFTLTIYSSPVYHLHLLYFVFQYSQCLKMKILMWNIVDYMLIHMEKNKEMRRMALMHRMKQLFNIIQRVCQSAARIKPWTHPFTVQRAAMSPKSNVAFMVLWGTEWYFQVLIQSSLVISWKPKKVLGSTSCFESKVKGYCIQWHSAYWSR